MHEFYNKGAEQSTERVDDIAIQLRLAGMYRIIPTTGEQDERQR